MTTGEHLTTLSWQPGRVNGPNPHLWGYKRRKSCTNIYNPTETPDCVKKYEQTVTTDHQESRRHCDL